MGQTVVNEDAAGQRKHLGFVLQTTERRRIDQTVAVALEFGAVIVAQGVLLLAETLVGNEL